MAHLAAYFYLDKMSPARSINCPPPPSTATRRRHPQCEAARRRECIHRPDRTSHLRVLGAFCSAQLTQER
eukprot:scaffold177097_cov27-Tisochrysis_lutea.AAC.2